MGIIDDLTDSIGTTIKSGSEMATRAGAKFKIAGMLKHIERRKTAAYARLGESMAPVVASRPELLEGREQLMAEIASAEAYKALLVQELKSMGNACDAPAKPLTESLSAGYGDGAVFGSTIAFACPLCGQAIAQGDTFCTTCGVRFDWGGGATAQ